MREDLGKEKETALQEKDRHWEKVLSEKEHSVKELMATKVRDLVYRLSAVNNKSKMF